jgi:hypothetical protein
VSTPGKPDLDRLVTALTADGRPDELTGREAAAAAFRAAQASPLASGRQKPVFSPSSLRRSFLAPARGGIRRLAAVGAVVVVAAGVAVAAYAQALPGPAQDVAHTVFAPLGVPDNQSGHSAAVTIATSGAKSGRAAPGGKTKTPTPRPGDAFLIAVAVSRARVQAGERVAFTGRVTEYGQAAAGVRVRLFERLAGSTQFELVGTGVTGPLGGFRLASPPLSETAIFRVAGPDATHSAAVRVTVAAPRVTAPATLSPAQAPTGRR